MQAARAGASDTQLNAAFTAAQQQRQQQIQVSRMLPGIWIATSAFISALFLCMLHVLLRYAS